jgi:hypothetical protein
MTARLRQRGKITAGDRLRSEEAVSALCKAYASHEAASAAVVALQAIGVTSDRLRVFTGAPLHDVRKERVGEFAGTVGPEAPVGSFGDVPHRRDEPKADFASTHRAGRVGTFADADRDTVTTYADGVGRIHVTGDHDVESILTDAGLDIGAAEHDVRALHDGWTLVLVRETPNPERVRRVLEDAR